MKQADDLKKKGAAETQRELTDEDLAKVSGGYMLWRKTCQFCGGSISNDPNTPYEIRCHCNEDSEQGNDGDDPRNDAFFYF